MARPASLRGAPDATLNDKSSLTSDDVSSWEEIERQVTTMCAVYAGDSSVNPRIMALADLTVEKTYEALSDITVVDVYQAAYEGDLQECTTIIDVHLRMVAECIIKDDTALVRSVYDKFRRMPPMLQKSSLIATAAVAEAGLLYIKEDYDLVEALLREQVEEDGEGPGRDEDMYLEWAKSKVIIDMMERVIAVMHDEKGEVDGELLSSGQPSIAYADVIIDVAPVQPPPGAM